LLFAVIGGFKGGRSREPWPHPKMPKVTLWFAVTYVLGKCSTLTLVWASENTAFSAHVSPYIPRKTFGGWGFAPDPEWGADIA